MPTIREGELFRSEGELSPFNSKLIATTIQVANWLGLPENHFISFDELNSKITLSPASAFFGRETQDALCSITQQALDRPEDVDYGNFIKSMQLGVRRKLQKDPENEILTAVNSQIEFLLEHMGDFDGDKVRGFNDNLLILSQEVSEAFTNLNTELFFIDRGLGQMFFNSCVGIASRQIISQAVVKMSSGEFKERRMFDELIVPVKQTLRHLAGHELKLNREWTTIASGGKGHFEKRTAKRRTNLQGLGDYSKAKRKGCTVGPGRHRKESKFNF